MSSQGFASQKGEVNQALEASIQIGLAALLVIGCLVILYPFSPLIMWGIIIAIASYPTYLKLQRLLKGRGTLAAVLWTLLLLAVLIVPLVLLAENLIEGIQPLVARLRDGTLALPQSLDLSFGGRGAQLPEISGKRWSSSLLRSKLRSPAYCRHRLELVGRCCSSSFQSCCREFCWRMPEPPLNSPAPWRFGYSVSKARNTSNL